MWDVTAAVHEHVVQVVVDDVPLYSYLHHVPRSQGACGSLEEAALIYLEAAAHQVCREVYITEQLAVIAVAEAYTARMRDTDQFHRGAFDATRR